MKNFNMVRKYGRKVSGAALVASAFVVSSVQAAYTPPAGLTNAAADVTGGVDYMTELFWPIIIAVFVAVTGMKLFKRFGSKI